jgi:hypothetical protein
MSRKANTIAGYEYGAPSVPRSAVSMVCVVKVIGAKIADTDQDI